MALPISVGLKEAKEYDFGNNSKLSNLFFKTKTSEKNFEQFFTDEEDFELTPIIH